MRRNAIGSALVLLLMVGHARAADEAAGPDDVKLRVTHRIYTSFVDTMQVELGEEYQIGDTEFSLVVTEFHPDFGIKEGGEVINRSPEPCNPAFHIQVFEAEEMVDSVWSFFGQGGAPHFRRESTLAFEIVSFRWRDQLLSEPVPRKKSES
jgi:hypothetical protein